MPNLWISEEMVDVTKSHRYGDGEPYETSMETPGEVYRYGLKEHGRCVGRVYVDRKDAPPLAVGWVFQKRRRYEDARPGDKEPTYLAECWLTVHKGKPIKTVEYQYA